MGWLFFNALERFEEFRGLWDGLNRSSGNHILLDSGFVAPLLRHFGSNDTTLAVREDDAGNGIALLAKNGTGSWSTFQPSQAPLGLILLNNEGLPHLLKALPGYSVMLSVLQQDPSHSSFRTAPASENIEVVKYIETAQLELSGTFDEYWEGRSRNLKHNLDRQSRRIAEQGRTLELVALRERSRLADGVREYGRLEAMGWKAAQGTAIEQDNVQGAFYMEMLENLSASGEALIFQLRLDGNVIASDLCVLRDGTFVVLKTAYDETIEKVSPALLMRREIMRWLFAEGEIRNVEFYGRVLQWHTQWMTRSREMFHINLFRNRYVMPARELLKTLR